MADTSIAPKVKRCLELNNQVVQLLDHAADELPEGVPLELNDQRSRFKIWSANVGAHRTGTSSLEYRLRDASHIKEVVLSLLDDLQKLIGDASAIISGDMVPWDRLPADEQEDGDSDDPDMPSTELEQIVMSVKEVVDGLLRLSMTIRNPAPHDRFMASLNTDTTYYEDFDTNHVKAKFGEMESWLAERLGKAISRRRQYFKYRRNHHDKLAYGIDENTEKVAPSTLASSIPEKFKESTDFAAGDDESDSGWLSQTSFATSVQQAERLRVPPLPTEAQQGPFECPYCYMIISVTDRRSWKKHVFGDLRPYVCLEHDCLNPEQEFTRRHDWIDHMSQNHWTVYYCPAAGCVKTFRSAAACRGHVERSHSGQIQEHQLDALISLHAEKGKHKTGFQCPFCNESQSSLAWYRRHVGRHKEELSLFALPAIGADEAKREIAEDDHSDALDAVKASNAGNFQDDDSVWDSEGLDDVELLRQENDQQLLREGTDGQNEQIDALDTSRLSKYEYEESLGRSFIDFNLDEKKSTEAAHLTLHTPPTGIPDESTMPAPTEPSTSNLEMIRLGAEIDALKSIEERAWTLEKRREVTDLAKQHTEVTNRVEENTRSSSSHGSCQYHSAEGETKSEQRRRQHEEDRSLRSLQKKVDEFGDRHLLMKDRIADLIAEGFNQRQSEEVRVLRSLQKEVDEAEDHHLRIKERVAALIAEVDDGGNGRSRHVELRHTSGFRDTDEHHIVNESQDEIENGLKEIKRRDAGQEEGNKRVESSRLTAVNEEREKLDTAATIHRNDNNRAVPVSLDAMLELERQEVLALLENKTQANSPAERRRPVSASPVASYRAEDRAKRLSRTINPEELKEESGSHEGTRRYGKSKVFGGNNSIWQCCNCSHGWFSMTYDTSCPNCHVGRCSNCLYAVKA